MNIFDKNKLLLKSICQANKYKRRCNCIKKPQMLALREQMTTHFLSICCQMDKKDTHTDITLNLEIEKTTEEYRLTFHGILIFSIF